MSNRYEEIQNYYGKELQTSADLKTNACCTLEAPAQYIREALKKIHDEVQSKYYGCGLTIPTELKGKTVLDLGSGSGRDCYIAAQLVGENGRVIGVDMTDEQLAVANKYLDYHREEFGYKNSNTTFLKGNIEQLDRLDIEEKSVDIIISNCVINLAQDKHKVLKDAFRLLREGGEIYFSDVYADRRVPESLQNDPVLWGECLSGALYWNDFLRAANQAGFTDPRMVETKPISVENTLLKEKLGNIQFHSVTYRLFKISELETACEEYGQAVKYKGTIEHSKTQMVLDDHHIFEAGKIESVCGNTYLMLNKSRYREHFEFYGDFSTHYGIFEGCGENAPFSLNAAAATAANSCC